MKYSSLLRENRCELNATKRNNTRKRDNIYIYIYREVIRSGVEETKANRKCVGVSRYKKEEHYRMLRQREKERAEQRAVWKLDEI